jgi:hypothetical protein
MVHSFEESLKSRIHNSRKRTNHFVCLDNSILRNRFGNCLPFVIIHFVYCRCFSLQNQVRQILLVLSPRPVKIPYSENRWLKLENCFVDLFFSWLSSRRWLVPTQFLLKWYGFEIDSNNLEEAAIPSLLDSYLGFEIASLVLYWLFRMCLLPEKLSEKASFSNW